MPTQTFWLSFCDAGRPKGQQFLGVAIVDVTDDDAGAIAEEVTARRALHGLPPADPEVDWLAAAIRKAHQTGCNPGGAVASLRIDDVPGFAERDARLPRNRLLSRAEVDALDS